MLGGVHSSHPSSRARRCTCLRGVPSSIARLHGTTTQRSHTLLSPTGLIRSAAPARRSVSRPRVRPPGDEGVDPRTSRLHDAVHRRTRVCAARSRRRATRRFGHGLGHADTDGSLDGDHHVHDGCGRGQCWRLFPARRCRPDHRDLGDARRARWIADRSTTLATRQTESPAPVSCLFWSTLRCRCAREEAKCADKAHDERAAQAVSSVRPDSTRERIDLLASRVLRWNVLCAAATSAVGFWLFLLRGPQSGDPPTCANPSVSVRRHSRPVFQR